jgi:hypothetical protein
MTPTLARHHPRNAGVQQVIEKRRRVRALRGISARSGCCSGPEVERILRVLATVADDSGATNAVLIKLALSEHRETVMAVPNSEPRTRVSPDSIRQPRRQSAISSNSVRS